MNKYYESIKQFKIPLSKDLYTELKILRKYRLMILSESVLCKNPVDKKHLIFIN